MAHRTSLTILQMNDSHAYCDLHQEMFWQGAQAVHRRAGGYARVATNVLRTREQADLIVLISHLGFPQDMKLVSEVPGIDVCLGGHRTFIAVQGGAQPGVGPTGSRVCAPMPPGHPLHPVVLDLAPNRSDD